MAKYRFKARLTKDSIDNLIKDINDYRNKLPYKIQVFTKRLAEYGIQVAKSNIGIIDNLGNVSYLISFQMETQIEDGKTITVLRAFDSQKIISKWVNQYGLQVAEVSPLLMAEFGSGHNAYDIFNGVYGQGTFPGQTHAFDTPGWHWKDVDGKWHFSSGIMPTQPMYKAFIEMETIYKRVAREVFG